MQWEKPKVYAVKNINETVRMSSRSGGIFPALSDTILEEQGVVYGCILNEKFEAVHVRADNKTERDKMCGSKYVQSKMGDTYKKVKLDLQSDKKELFSGTSCQVAGLKAFLGKEYDNLLCVDIVCHGVPSLKVWKKYIRWQESRNHAKVIEVNFRNKKDFGWREHVERLRFDNNKVVDAWIFKTLFSSNVILRPSCYKCLYKSIMHPGDITIADYWGIEKAALEFDDNKGVSLVLINNQNGENEFEKVKDRVKWKQTKIEDSMQPALIKPFERPENREKFWQDFENDTFDSIAKEYGGYTFSNKIKYKLKKEKQRLMKR